MAKSEKEIIGRNFSCTETETETACCDGATDAVAAAVPVSVSLQL